MYAFTAGVDINVPAARIWRALCSPAEVVQWDTGVMAAIDAPSDYPQPGQHVRWRYRNGLFRILHDRPQEVTVERKLRSQISIGPFDFDETYLVEPSGSGCRLSAAMHVRAPLLLGGTMIERLYLGPKTEQTVTASLQAIKRHCEVLL